MTAEVTRCPAGRHRPGFLAVALGQDVALFGAGWLDLDDEDVLELVRDLLLAADEAE